MRVELKIIILANIRLFFVQKSSLTLQLQGTLK